MDWTNTENVRENMQKSCQLASIYKYIGMLGAVSKPFDDSFLAILVKSS